MAEFGGNNEQTAVTEIQETTTVVKPRKRGPYKKSSKFRDLALIRHKIVNESKTDAQISNDLGIPLRTVERYKREIWLKDPDLIDDIQKEPLMIDMKIAYEKFLWTEQDLKERLAAVPKEELSYEVIDCHKLLLDLAWYNPRIKRASPARAVEILRELTGNGGK